jgi:hypothetical protein
LRAGKTTVWFKRGGYDMKVLKTTLLAVAAVWALSSPAQAEVTKHMSLENGRLHPYYTLAFTPPKGWAEDAGATAKFGVPIYLPNGTGFGDAPALMYVRVSYNSDRRSLEKFISVAHERWVAEAPGATITMEPDQSRISGGPDFKIYRFYNPGKPQQAYELMAYGEDKDADGNAFVLMIGLSSATRSALDKAAKDFRAGLHSQ